MRIDAPGALDDARRLAPLARLAEEASRERRRRHEVGRELCRLTRERGRARGLGRGQGLRLRGEQHRALAAIGAPVDELALQVTVEPLERAGPCAGDAAKF